MPSEANAPSPSWTIGCDPACDIVVNAPHVSGRHCRLMLHQGRFVLDDLGSLNGTFVNGFQVTRGRPVYVSKEDHVTLGRSVALPWPQTQQPGNVITIGRNPVSDIRLDFPMISWDHAKIVRQGESWIIEDLGSKNGTALNRPEETIRRAPLKPEDMIFLGSYKISAATVLTSKHITKGGQAFEQVRFKGNRMVLGRDPGCDYPLNYPMISWRHAALERTPQGFFVEDLGSRNGTYVNGVRISGRATVKPGQEIGLGSFRFQLRPDGDLAKREYKGNVTIEAQGVVVTGDKNERLLESVSLTIFPSEFVALMGPSGAGKTTFLKALNGYTPPADGSVLFNGDSLYKSYDEYRMQMGYVPQDDIVHSQLTVREALYFNAKLRTDLKDSEIEKRIDDILKNLNLEDTKHKLIGSPERKVLSGGQRKRVNIAMELMSDTPVIFLDEPTSGLSSYDAEGVIKLLKKLSGEGKTIIATIHQPSAEIFKRFDCLIMLCKDPHEKNAPPPHPCGTLAYFGPAYPDSIEFFDPQGAHAVRQQPGKDLNPEMLLSGLSRRRTAEWVKEYDGSNFKTLYVRERSGKVPSAAPPKTPTPARRFNFAQWVTLVRRNIILKIRDRAQTIILLAQAPVFAILVGKAFEHLQVAKVNDQESLTTFLARMSGLEFLMVVAAIWFGCNNVARDIVGELSVYHRERMINLNLPSYIFSKLAVAALLSLIQCASMLAIVTAMCFPSWGGFPGTFAALYLASMVGAALGLCVSALAPTTEAAIALLPLILLPMIALGGGIIPIKVMDGKKGVMSVATSLIPSRWAFDACLRVESRQQHGADPSTNDFEDQCRTNRQTCDIMAKQFTKDTPYGWCLAILAAMSAVWTAVALVLLGKRKFR